MKKIVSLSLALTLLLLCCSCASSENVSAGDAKDTATVENIDVDLTKLSSTMVYSEVYNMVNTPDDYIGKTVKMGGLFSVYESEEMNRNYYACIIKDATACCQQGIEFVMQDNLRYPEEYPEDGSDICVVGVFNTYMEGEEQYCQLENAKFVEA